MSIVLKGIDMPETNEIRMIAINSNGKVFFNTVKDGTPDKTKMSQAIQIPKGHGRLIDADALVAVFKDMAKCEWNQKAFPISWAYAFEDTIDEIHGAPTILEAEE